MSTKGKILYAEDELGLSMAVSEILKMEGFEVTAVMDGLAADEVLQKEHFDIAILDIYSKYFSLNFSSAIVCGKTEA